MAADRLTVVQRSIREEFESEAASGFRRLRRVPDTLTRHFLDYFESLGAIDQDALVHACSLRGACTFLGISPVPELRTNAAWQRWMMEMSTGKGRDPHFYYSVPLLRLAAAESKIRQRRGTPSSEWDRRIEAYASTVHGLKAPELRKLVAASLKSAISARPSNAGGGVWMYEGELDGRRVVMSADYGGRSAQVRYAINVESTEPPMSIAGIGLERLLGIALGDWDFIVVENAEDSMRLLVEIIRYFVGLPARLVV